MDASRPTLDELERISEAFGLHPTKDELEAYQRMADGLLASYARVERLTDPTRAVRYPRDEGAPPAPGENPLNAWAWRATVRGAAHGKLHGKTVAIKDNTCVAGLPMLNGSPALLGYVPDVDATAVTRILDAGATILGKATCEDMSFSAGSHTSVTGPVLNPHDHTRQAGGSSSGSAALVAAGEVDLATGADQGGSVRIPAAWCGVVGFKPTYGLVPYTGVAPIEHTLDHYGPLAPTVRDAALLLEVLAGPDPLDPRTEGVRPADGYVDACTGEAEGLRVGLLTEGFKWPRLHESDVDDIVRDEAVRRFEAAGATVEWASIPLHRDVRRVWDVISTEGAHMTLIRGHSMGTNVGGLHLPGLVEAFATGFRDHGDELAETVKRNAVLGELMHERTHGRLYAKAQNLRRAMARAYDDAFGDCDVLVMPTVPFKPRPIVPRDGPPERVSADAAQPVQNTAPFNATGHPAISVNAGWSDGLPVGAMIVGRRHRDRAVLRAADAFERRGPP